MADIAIDLHRDLINSCIEGKSSAFHQLYRLYSKAMYNAALRIVGNSEEAEDILQEAFVSAFTKIKSYKGDSTFGAWLKRIVVNTAINHLRRKRMNIVPLDDSPLEIAEADDDEISYNIDSIKKAILQLPEGYRIVLSLYLLEGYDHNEIAEILHISASTSKSQYNRAKNKLRNLLKKREVYYG